MFNGDWEAANVQAGGNGNFGFFLMPGETADSPYVAMSAPATYVIPATAQHPDETAFFFDWIHTNEVARQIVLDVTGSTPGGPADLPQPEAEPGSVTAETLAAAALLSEDNGAIDFIGNATPGILTESIGPNLQLLIEGRTTPEDFVADVQEQYVTELGR